MKMSVTMRTILVLIGGLLLMAITVLAYLSVYFTASQPDNYGHLRFKGLAWGCIIAFLAELAVTIWAMIRIK